MNMARQRICPDPIRHGTKDTADDGSSWVNWWLFSPPLNDDQIEEFMEDNDLESYYEGPGMGFSRCPGVTRSQ
jgi:hypothetical protein